MAFLITALDDLDVMAADIGNAYQNALHREKIYTVAGPEFGTEEGTIFIVVRALYGLKSAGANWRSFFSQTLVTEMGLKSTRGDPNAYIHPQTKPDGFRLKEDSLGPPSHYLGAAIKVYTDRDGVQYWAMSSDEYVKIAV
eukprot:6593559-Ditylum_brightwellii.AAC.1